MNIFCYPNGAFAVNTYVCIESGKSLIIDPGSGSLRILNDLISKKVLLVGVLITHPHIDHVEGVPIVHASYPACPVYISSEGDPVLEEIPAQARIFGIPETGPICATSLITDEHPFHIDIFTVTPLFTPGHSIGSLSYAIHGVIFTGDLLFRETIGRTDLTGGDYSTLIASIRNKILPYADETPVYPGHGSSTTVGHERRNNPFL
jgi:hydroxyacylglutathione hydrolase